MTILSERQETNFQQKTSNEDTTQKVVVLENELRMNRDLMNNVLLNRVKN